MTLVWNSAFMASTLLTLHVCTQTSDRHRMSVPATTAPVCSGMPSMQDHVRRVCKILATAACNCEQADLGLTQYKSVYLQLLLPGTLLFHHSSRLFLADHGSGLACLAFHFILFLHKCILIAQQYFLVVLSGQDCNHQERHAVTNGTAS